MVKQRAKIESNGITDMLNIFKSEIGNFLVKKDLDFSEIENILEENKYKYDFYLEMVEFYHYIKKFDTAEITANDVIVLEYNFVISGKPAEKYKRLLEKVKSFLFSNEDILREWKDLERTYLDCDKEKNFKLLFYQKQSYRYSDDPRKKLALVLFESMTRRVYKENLEQSSALTAMTEATSQLISQPEKIKTAVINPMLAIGGTAIASAISFSGNTLKAVPQRVGNALISALKNPLTTTNKTLAVAIYLLAGQPISAVNDARNSYEEDLKKSEKFLDWINKNRWVKFRFQDTVFVIKNGKLTRYSNPGGYEQSILDNDYRWFMEGLAIYVIKNKLSELCPENKAIYEKITQRLLGMEYMELSAYTEEYNNKNNVVIDIPKKEDSQFRAALEDFVLQTNEVSSRLKHRYPEEKDLNQDSFSHILQQEIKAIVNGTNGSPCTQIQNGTAVFTEGRTIVTSLVTSFIGGFFNPTKPASTDLTPTPYNTTAKQDTSILLVIIPIVMLIIFFPVTVILFYKRKQKSPASSVEGGQRNPVPVPEIVPLLGISCTPGTSSTSRDDTDIVSIKYNFSDTFDILALVDLLEKRLNFLSSTKGYDRLEKNFSILKTNVKNFDYKACTENITKINNKLNCEENNKHDKSGMAMQYAKVLSGMISERFELLNALSSFNKIRISYLPVGFRQDLGNEIQAQRIRIDNLKEKLRNKRGLYKGKDKDKNKVSLFDCIDELEKALYDITLSAHIQGCFEKYGLLDLRSIVQTKNREDFISLQENPDSTEDVLADLRALLFTMLTFVRTLGKDTLKISDEKSRTLTYEAFKLFEDSMNELIISLDRHKEKEKENQKTLESRSFVDSPRIQVEKDENGYICMQSIFPPLLKR